MTNELLTSGKGKEGLSGSRSPVLVRTPIWQPWGLVVVGVIAGGLQIVPILSWSLFAAGLLWLMARPLLRSLHRVETLETVGVDPDQKIKRAFAKLQFDSHVAKEAEGFSQEFGFFRQTLSDMEKLIASRFFQNELSFDRYSVLVQELREALRVLLDRSLELLQLLANLRTSGGNSTEIVAELGRLKAILAENKDKVVQLGFALSQLREKQATMTDGEILELKVKMQDFIERSQSFRQLQSKT